MENTENTVNPAENIDEAAVESVVNEAKAEVPADTEAAVEAEERTDDETDTDYIDEEAELSELRRVSGIEYGSLEDFAGYQRYLELKQSGIITAEEAFYAVNRGKTAENDSARSSARTALGDNSKKHMTASRRKPSSGAVFTRADREELAKWGISATGSELERLWREVSEGK